jgi:hypothetical protein
LNEICGRDEVWQPIVTRLVSNNRLRELRVVLRGSVSSWRGVYQLEAMQAISVNLSDVLSAGTPSAWQATSRKVATMPVINLARHGCIGTDGAQQLAQMLMVAKSSSCSGGVRGVSLQSLGLDHQLIRDKGLDALTTPVVDVCVCLSRLSLRNCRLSPQANVAITRILTSCMPLQSLDLSDNKLDDSSCAAVCQGFAARLAAGLRTGFEALLLDGNSLGEAAAGSVMQAFLSVNAPAAPIVQGRTLSLRGVGLTGKSDAAVTFASEWCRVFPRITAEAQKRRPWNAREVGADGVEIVKPSSYPSLYLYLDNGEYGGPVRTAELAHPRVVLNVLKSAAAVVAANAKNGEPILLELPAHDARSGGGNDKGCSVC